MTKVTSQTTAVKRLFSKLCWDKCTGFLFKYGIGKGFLTMTQSPEGKKEKTDKI